MKVFILTAGPHYEGTTLTRAFDSMEKAVKAVDSIEPGLSNKKWEKHEKIAGYWQTDMDWLSISEIEVE